MPKMKTRKSAAKRFRATGKGKFKRNRAYKSHILTSKSRKRKRKLRQGAVVNKTNESQLRRMLPYA
ncbi:MAG TPA: 50S ribosomal protein L35 [bacterium]|nr:50S ribosomal protein L35 [bacterium]